MPLVGVVCEGDGDEEALRVLLYRIAATENLPLVPGEVLPARGRGNLTTPGGIEKYFRLVATGHVAVLIVLDADRDCPVQLARGLARRIRALRPSIAVGITAANAAFEAWFLADLSSIAGQTVKGRILIPDLGEPPADPDGVHNPKARLIALTAAATTYKETSDQPSLASMIDPDVVAERSRSFRRLVGALRGLADAVATGRVDVTP